MGIRDVNAESTASDPLREKAMTVLDEPSSSSRLEAQPLYVKARNIMVDRLISGQWRPGQVLPSEFAIAAELGVSQGTVRKALDDMTAEGLVVRKQGRGTFVAEAEDKSILFRLAPGGRNEPKEQRESWTIHSGSMH